MNLRRLPLGLFVFVAAVAGHAASLGGGFVYDDEAVVLQNRENLRDPSTLLRFTSDPSVFNGTKGNAMFRPVAYASHVLDSLVWGWTDEGPRPAGWHLTNLLLHAATALALYHLLRRLLRSRPAEEPFGPAAPDAASAAAALGALWFGLQPVNSEVVNYVSARSESLAALFFLLSLWAHHAAWEDGVPRGRRALLVAGSLAAALLSFGSKETGILLPAVAGAFELWARPGERPAPERLRTGVLRALPLLAGLLVYIAVRRAAMSGAPSEVWGWRALAGVAVVGAVAWIRVRALERLVGRIRPGLAAAAAIGLVFVGGVVWAASSGGDAGPDPMIGGGRSLPAHLLTQARVVAASGLLLVFPVDLAPDHGVRVAAALDLATATALLALLVVVVLVVRAALRGSRTAPLVALWVAAAAAPSVIVPLNVLMNEHRLYLPCTGLALGAGLLLLAVLRAAARAGHPFLGAAPVAGVLCLFIAVDASRAAAWGDPFLLWYRAAETSPDSWRNQMHLGVEFYRFALRRYGDPAFIPDSLEAQDVMVEQRASLDMEAALQKFEEAYRLYPRAFATRLNLGYHHLYRGMIANRAAHPDAPRDVGEYLQAIRWFTLAEEASPNSYRALYNRASAMALAGMVPEAIAEFERLAQDRSRTTMYAWPLADLYRRAGRTEDALAQLDLVERIQPAEAGAAALRRAEVLVQARRFIEAEKELRRAAGILGEKDPAPPLYMARLLVATGLPENLAAAGTLWRAALDRGHRPGPKDAEVLRALGAK